MSTDSAQAETIQAPTLASLVGTENGACAEADRRSATLDRFLSSRWILIAVFLASVLLTLSFWRILPDSFRWNEQSDYPEFYEPVARSLLAGHGFVLNDGKPATAFPPGYPLILAGVFQLSKSFGVSEQFGLSVLAAVAMALTAVFVFRLARDLFGVKAALLSAGAWMTYPFALWLTKQPNSELPFMMVFYGGVALFWYAIARKRSAQVFFWCGILFGVAMLIRPIAMGIALVLSVVIWFARRELSTRARTILVVMLLLGSLVAVVPWEAWAYHKTNKVIPLSTNGVRSFRDGVTFAVETKGYREGIRLPANVVELMADIRPHKEEIVTFSDAASTIAREFQARPVAVTELFLIKLARSWYATDSGRKEWPILLIQLAYLFVIAWAARKTWKRGGLHRTFALTALLVVAYFWCMTFLALSILRYMVPVFGLLFVLIAAGSPKHRRLQEQRSV